MGWSDAPTVRSLPAASSLPYRSGLSVGRVTRVCQISRSGKKWKQLGEIGELATFFDIADEARLAAGKALPTKTLLGHPNVVPRAPVTPSAQASAIADVEASAPELVQPQPVASSQSHTKPPAPEIRERDDARPTGEWAAGGALGKMRTELGGHTGPVARGPVSSAPQRLPRASSHAEIEIAGLSARVGERKGEYENGAFVPTEDVNDMPPRGAGSAIAIASILIILGGLAVLYFVVFRENKDDTDKIAAVDARTAVVVALDAGPGPTVDPADVDGALTFAKTEIRGDSVAGLEVALDRLGKLPQPAQNEIPVQGTKARLLISLAQHKIYEAAGLSRPSAKKRTMTGARKYATSAEKLGRKIFDRDGSNLDGLVVLAEALRIRDRPSNHASRFIRKALKIDPANRDALLAKAMLHLRDDNERQARKILESNASSDDVRFAYRLARLQMAAKEYSGAKKSVAAALAAEPDHEGASALTKQLAELAIEDPDPPPPDDPGSDDPATDVDSYDVLLSKADSAAEGGDCGKAIALYQKAVDVKPNGVAALTGLGYCFLNGGRYSSAHSKFRAALSTSSRYQDAMWGMAELYERQGNKSEALARYKKFLDAHPGSGRAGAARRKIDGLGGAAAPTPGSGSAKPTEPTTPPDTPPDTGGGSGADSSGDTPIPPTPQ